MSCTQPFLTKFARRAPSSEQATQDKTASDLQTVHLAPEITPRPTTHTLVNAETTDDR